jgi:hypothetical protein
VEGSVGVEVERGHGRKEKVEHPMGGTQTARYLRRPAGARGG